MADEQQYSSSILAKEADIYLKHSVSSSQVTYTILKTYSKTKVGGCESKRMSKRSEYLITLRDTSCEHCPNLWSGRSSRS